MRKLIITKLTAILSFNLILINSALAGLPPTTIQGQADASPKTKFSFQVPNSQATDLGGIKTLIETGNQNILPDPGFESGGTTKWTASGGATATVNTTAKGTGAYGYDWDSNAAGQTLTGTLVPIPPGLKGKNAVVSCNVYTVSGTATHTLAAWDGTTAYNPTTVNSVSGAWQRTSVNFIMPTSGSITMQAKSVASNEPEAYVDDCLIEDASFYNLANGTFTTPWQSFTMTIAGATSNPTKGTVSRDEARWRRVGDSMEIQYDYTQTAAGSAGSGTYLFTIPNSYTIDSTKITFSTTDGTSAVGVSGAGASASNLYVQNNGVVSAYDSTHLAINFIQTLGSGPPQYVGSGADGLGNAKVVYTFHAMVPITQFTDQAFYRPDQTPASWSGTQVGAGGGWATTATSYGDFSVATTSNNITPTATAINITCAAESTKLPGITCTLPRQGNYRVCASGTGSNGTSGSAFYTRLTDGSGNVINGGVAGTSPGGASVQPFSVCGRYYASSGGSSTFKVQGRATSSSTASLNQASDTPITWTVDELDAPLGAPYLMGSVTSNTSGQERVERVLLSGTCSSTPCTIASQSGSWVTSVSRSGAGAYTINIAAGEFSASPTCTMSVASWSGSVPVSYGIAPSSSTAVSVQTYTGTTPTAADVSGLAVICMGPR